jgi:hypothetical protein
MEATEDELNKRYEVVKKVVELFKFERFTYLSVTAISLIVLIIAIHNNYDS